MRDIESFTFSTNKPTTGPNEDWFFQIYTLPNSTAQLVTGNAATGNSTTDSAWYGRRFQFVNNNPQTSAPLNKPASTWNDFGSFAQGGFNMLGATDHAPLSLAGGVAEGLVDGPTLNAMTTSIINWASYPGSGSTAVIDYRDEIVWFMTLNTQSGYGTPNTLLDNFSFKIKDVLDPGADPDLVAGTQVFIDFEDPNFVDPILPAPEPGTGLLLLMGLAGYRRLRRC